MPETRADRAIELLTAFAARTGLTMEREPQRYLWTDAFAVATLLGVARRTAEPRYGELALRLVDRVHHVLGRYRPGDHRRGWISGLGEREGEAHPTRGGLRIGKPLPERGPDDPPDERREWDRDGQYFHYLTKWMHALDLVARETGRVEMSVWSRELAEAAHRAFTYVPRGGGRKRMYWKMSVDLSRPLVTSMGHHDPLDGFITCVQLQSTASILSATGRGPNVGEEAADFASMVEPEGLATDDPLGLGGLLMDACRVAQLIEEGAFDGRALLAHLIAAAAVGIRHYAASGEPSGPAGRRLAFRELGLAIGLAGLDRVTARPELLRGTRIEELSRFAPLRDRIESFWLDPESQRARTWLEHRDINDVMLAASLVPEGVLVLRRPASVSPRADPR